MALLWSNAEMPEALTIPFSYPEPVHYHLEYVFFQNKELHDSFVKNFVDWLWKEGKLQHTVSIGISFQTF